MTTVLVVDDEPLTAAAHDAYVRRVPGFEVLGIATTAQEALAALAAPDAVGLVVLDLHLPDGHGLEICRRLRQAGSTARVLVVTGDRELRSVRAAVALGVADYLLKPFTFDMFRDKLERAAGVPPQAPAAVTQGQIDGAFAHLRGTPPSTKGLQAATLERIAAGLGHDTASSAAEIAERVDLARVTVRRYLEHLVETGRASRSPRYGHPGRPEYEYRLR